MRPSLRDAARGFVAAVAVAMVAVACGKKEPDAKTPLDPEQAAKALAARKAGVLPGPVTGHLVASVGERVVGPFLARRTDRHPAGMAAWATAAEGSARRIIVVPLAADGEPRGAEHAVANAPVDTTTLVLRPMRGPAPGFIAAWTVLANRGQSLFAVAVGDDGTPRGKPIELARTSDAVVWVDVVPTDKGAVTLWAEETREGDANIVAAAIDTDGKVRGVPARVATGVSGWHALEIAKGVGLSTVKSPPQAQGVAVHAGTLSYQKLDAEGHPVGTPLAIATKPTVTGDVEVSLAGGRTLFAWTDRGGDEPFVAGAAIDETSVVVPPHRIVEGRGGAALLGIASGAAGPAILWESPVRKSPDFRRVQFARIDEALALASAPLSFETFGRGAPELAAAPGGFAVLGAMRDCDFGESTCPSAPVISSLVRMDAKGAPLQRETFTFGADPASVAWNLTCGAEDCLALSASGAGPARVRVAEVRPRTNFKGAATAKADVATSAAHVSEVAAIVRGESVVDMAAAHFGSGAVLATLGTSANGAVAKPRARDITSGGPPLVLSTRVVDEAGVVSAPLVLSPRALAVGGVAIAAMDKPEDGGAVAWVARENGDLEVHVTRIDKRGKRTNDVQLTTTKGDASDVAIVWAGGGFVVAWVDFRDGNGEVYATKVSPDLSRVAREERITHATGDASDLVALGQGDRVWLAWSDSRESPKDGMADIYVAAVHARNAKRVTEEVRVMPTAAHSRTPALSAVADGITVAWIEETPSGLESPEASGYGAMWATIDASGKVSGRPAKIPLGGKGAPSALALDPKSGALHAVIARATDDGIALDGIDLSATPTAVLPLVMLDGPPSLDVAMLLDGQRLYFTDDGPTPTDKRIRRARVTWSR